MTSKIKYAIACVAMLFMCLLNNSCSSDGSDPSTDPNVPVGHKYYDTKSVPSSWGSIDVTLEQLSAKITDIRNSAEWVSAYASTYTSGAPAINITVKPNQGTTERSCNIHIITGSNNDELILTIKQEAPVVNDVHNETSSNPAYIRKRF